MLKILKYQKSDGLGFLALIIFNIIFYLEGSTLTHYLALNILGLSMNIIIGIQNKVIEVTNNEMQTLQNRERIR